MQHRIFAENRYTALLLSALTFVTLQSAACFNDTEEPTATEDPRLGKEKRVRFVNGCASSVTMPVGAKDTLTVQPAEENGTLPADLTPQSSDPSVISVAPGQDPFTIDMQAKKIGQTDIEVMSMGKRYDWLTFHVEPAKVVKFKAEPSVVAGGHLGVGVTDVFGACGTEDCALFGHGFLQWSVVPSGALTLLEDNLGIAHFTAGIAGTGDIVGKEPSGGAELVHHPVEVVDPTTITGLTGQLQIIPANSDPLAPVALPAKVPVNASFTIRIDGTRLGKPAVAISWHDIAWTVPPEITLVPQNEPADTLTALFIASDKTGNFTLTAKVALLANKEQTFVVTVGP